MSTPRRPFKEYITEMKAKKTVAVQALSDAFTTSAAVIVTERGSRPELWILSGNMGPDKKGHRVTYFGHDGPIGHVERDTLEELWDELYRDGAVYRPVGDAEVIAWTSTPEFEEGAKRVAYVQALNELGWLQSQAVTHDDKDVLREARSKAQSMDDIEKATAFLQRVIHAHHTKKNPSSFVANPTPWVTSVISAHFTELEELVPPAWLPKLAKTKAVGTTFTGELTEFGCGAYGCVLPTLDPKVVLKVTTDDTEAEFAAHLADKLPDPICVAYFKVLYLQGKTRGPRQGVRTDGEGAKIYLLWREEASEVGKIDEIVGDHAERAIHEQHTAAMAAFIAISKGEPHEALFEQWKRACGAMGRVKELGYVSAGLLRAADAGIFISDVHGGNLGLAMRSGKKEWVITDPGNVVVLSTAPTSARHGSR